MELKLTDIKPKTTDEKKLEENKIKELHDFYSVKHKNGTLEDIQIDKVKLVEKFIELGFIRYDTNDEQFVMIEIETNTIRRVSEKHITDKFIDFVQNMPPYNKEMRTAEGDTFYIEIKPALIKKKLYNGLENYFSKKLYERARIDKDITIQTDGIDSKYFYFKNGFVKITKAGYEFSDYSKLDNFVWKTSILQHNFEYSEEKGNFEKFFENITGKDKERKRSLMSICGYNLHGYFNYKTFLTLLTDSQLSESGEPNGRTGKTLLCKGLGKMLNASDDQCGYIEIDGKTFKPDDEKKYQTADIDTTLIHVNDIFSWFKIENLFTDITEGITIRKMYEKPFRILSKLMMSSNKSVMLEGSSARDRVVVFELSNHYSDVFSPEMEFKQWFFRDWDEKEYNRFFSFMIRCCKMFFEFGIIRPAEINYSEKILIEHTAPEFPAWFTHKMRVIKDEQILSNVEVVRTKRTLYFEFIEEYVDYKHKKGFSQAKFTKWIRKYCQWQKIKIREERSTEDIFVFEIN